jgi:uncharacterized membrane protein YhiD involved in acid resistance
MNPQILDWGYRILSIIITLAIIIVNYKIKDAVSEVKTDLATSKQELKDNSAAIKEELKDAIAEVRDEQNRVKEDLVSNQAEIKLDMNLKHQENKLTFVAHAAEDARQFTFIGQELKDIKQKLDDIS